MKHFTQFWLALLGLLNVQSLSAQLYEVPLNDRIDRSAYIFEGKVLESNSFYGPGGRMIYTSHLVQVYSVFKGEFPGDQVEIITEGGRVGDQAVWISHNLELGPNQHGIFFANPTSRPSDRQPNSGLSLRVYAGLQGFVKFHFDEINPKASEPFHVYRQPETELFPLIEAQTGQMRRNWEGASRASSDFFIQYFFSYPQLTQVGGQIFLDFEVEASVSGGSYELGDAGIFIEYDTSLLGSSLAGAGKVTISAGDVTTSTDYSFSATDYGTNVLEIAVDAADPPINLGEVDAWADDVVKVRVDVTGLTPGLDALFEQSLMQGESEYYDPVSGTYVLFPFVWAVDSVVYQATTAADTITAFFPNPITAGTHLSSLLTILGHGFGNTVGTVSFSNADDGGATLTSAVGADYVSWSDTVIQVLVPDVGSSGTAGTGSIRIVTSGGNVIESANPLTVRYSLINSRLDTFQFSLLPDTVIDTAVYIHHRNTNGLGGLTFRLDSLFALDTPAVADFDSALAAWRCATQINLSRGKDTLIGAWASDDISTVIYDGPIHPDSLGGSLAKTVVRTRFTQCFDQNGIIERPLQYIEEVDILIKDPSTTDWHFGTASPPAATELDFYTMILHELGHAHLLNHVIEAGSLMHWGYGEGDIIRSISPNQLEAGIRVVDTSSTQLQFCPLVTAMAKISPSTCTDVRVSVREFDVIERVIISPNPVHRSLTLGITISDGAYLGVPTFSFSDLTGRHIPVFPESSALLGNEGEWTFSVAHLPQGIYLLTIGLEGSLYTHKFVKN